MAAVNTERGREIIELESQDVRVLSSSLRQRPDGMIDWISTNGLSGVAGILPDNDARAVAAQARYAKSSISTIGRTHKLQTPTSDSMSKIGRRFGSKSFAGIMVDSGSTESLHGSAQRYAFSSHTGRPPEIRRAQGGGISSLGGRNEITASVNFGFPLNDSIVSFNSLETDGDAPLLLGVRDMHRLGMEYLTNLYAIRCGSTIIPVVRDQGHLFIRWHPHDTSSFFTLSELTRLHVRFGHPGWQRLHSFLQRATPDDLDADSQKQLRDIEAACRSCQHTAVAPRSFKIRVPHEHLEFNSEILVDLFWLGGRACLSVMDRDTKYTAAMFVPNQTVASVWECIQRCWLLRYLGPPSAMRHDAGVQFLTPKMYALAAAQGISCRPVPIEHPQGLGNGERYHSVIRRLYNRVKADHPSISDEYALDVALKALNDTMGTDGLTPTLLFYGVHPKLPLPNSSSTTMPQSERLLAMKLARDEYAKVVDEQKLKAVQRAQSPSVQTDLLWGDSVVVFRQTSRRWEGPLRFVTELEHGFQICDTHGDLKLFSKPCVRRYAHGLEFSKYSDPSGFYEPLSTLQLDTDVSPDRLRMSQDASLDTAQPSDGPVSNRSPATDRIYVPVRPSPDQAHTALPNAHPAPPMPPSEADPLSEQHSIAQDAQLAEVNAARRLKDLPPITNPDALVESFLEDVSYFSSYATHIVKPTDPRISEFKDAIKAEDDGLEQRQVFKREIIPLHKRKSLNILRSRYVHAIKNVGTPDQKHKSRLDV